MSYPDWLNPPMVMPPKGREVRLCGLIPSHYHTEAQREQKRAYYQANRERMNERKRLNRIIAKKAAP